MCFNSLRCDKGKRGNAHFALPAFAKCKYGGGYWEPFFCGIFAKFYRIIAEEKQKVRSLVASMKELDGTYAKSFVTKKLTVQKVLKAMENSSLNKYFGFVEYDEDVDLSKVREVTAEIDAVIDLHFGMVDAKKNCIRFRKLGQHKALGLYYPRYACLCVDIRSPERFVHEYGHLIDYTYGSLSGGRDFYDVAERYRKNFWAQFEALEEGNPFKQRLGGKTKYNSSYYLNQREIFARCFEVWVVKKLGIENSIVPKVESMESIIYPQDAGFLEMLDKYFKELFIKIRSGNVTAA